MTCPFGCCCHRKKSLLETGRQLPVRAGPGGQSPCGDDLKLDVEARALFEALRLYRLELARREAVPPYVVASDRTLRDIARLRPATR